MIENVYSQDSQGNNDRLDNAKSKSLLKNFLQYLRHPTYLSDTPKKESRYKFWDVFRLLSVSLILSYILGIIIMIALMWVGYGTDQHALSDPSIQENPLSLVFFAVLIAPILEELTFRMGLKYSPFRLSFTLAFLYIFISPPVSSFLETSLNETELILLDALVFLVIGFGVGLLLKSIEKEKVERFYSKNFFFIFYFFAVLFAGVHIFNYSNFEGIWFLIPLLVAPQFIGSLVMGYVRIHYGLHWSVLTHMLDNGVLFTPVLFIEYISSLNLSDISDFEMIGLTFSSLFILGLGLAVLFAFIMLLVEFVKK
ncbi:MAG: hypothetical protein V5A64_02705 [Candidatus Thermoplasmatota archaeon]